MAIRLTMTPTEEDLTGKSKWWGSADLPRGVAYPCYDGGGVDEEGFEDTLTFICQIRLEDIAPYDKEALLPRKGMLYFFANIDYFLGDDEAECEGSGEWDKASYTVLYAPDCSDLVTHKIVDCDGEDIALSTEAIAFSECEERDSGFKLLGKAFYNEYEEYAEHLSLLQLDEEERWGMRFFDMGMLNFLILPDELKRGEFDATVAYLHTL